MASYDSSNLMYVTKKYEEEVKEKIKRIYENDDVSQVIRSVDSQLNSILDEINSKLQFVNDKVADATTYRIGVHTQVDETRVNVKDLVSDGISETPTHLSAAAFKPNRSYTKYETYDYINKSLSYGNNAFVKLNGKEFSDNQVVQTFKIKHDLEEYMKIVEFAFTYKQFPNIVNKTNDKISTESTVTITRVFRGRFFILWADPKLEPGKFIVKAIVENADNTGNIIDKQIIDVRKHDDGSDDYSVIMDDGPQFDLYFTSDGDNLDISIGKITPYRWLIKKQFSNVNGEEDVNFDVYKYINNEIFTPEETYYSETSKTFIFVDKTHKKIGYCYEANNFNDIVLLDETSAISYNGEDINRFMYKEIGTRSFITINNASYIFLTDISVAIKLTSRIDDIFSLSSGEIVCLTDNKLKYFDQSTNKVIGRDFTAFESDLENPSVTLIEKDQFAIVFFTATDGVNYKLVEKSQVTGKFIDSSKSYIISKIDSFIVRDNLISTDIKVMDTPYGIHVVYTENGIFSQICTLRDLTVLGNIANYGTDLILKHYDYITGLYSTNDDICVKKIIHTSLFNFIITDTNKLYVIDDERISDPLHFTEKLDENGDILGYSDESGMIYMASEKTESELFISDKPYLQNVVDVVETNDGIYIFDKDGIFFLNSDKRIKGVFYVDGQNSGINGFVKNASIEHTFGLVSTLGSKETIYFKLDYTKIQLSNQKLNNEYLDLFSNEYELYDSDNIDSINFDKPVVDFHCKLYVSLIDHLSSIYNTDQTVFIEHNNTLHLSDVSKETNKTFTRLDENNLSKEYTTVFTPVLFTMKPNKYGFKLYKDILTYNKEDNLNISNLNSIKKFVIKRDKRTNVTFADVQKIIIEFFDKKYHELIDDTINIESVKEFMVINDKQYWTYDKEMRSGIPNPVLLDMNYMGSHFSSTDAVEPEEYGTYFPMTHEHVVNNNKFTLKTQFTPVGRFDLLENGSIMYNKETDLLSFLSYTSANNPFVCRTNDVYVFDEFFVDYIHNTNRMVVLGGGDATKSPKLFVYKCYDPTNSQFTQPFTEPSRLKSYANYNRFRVIGKYIYAWNSQVAGTFTIINSENLDNPEVINIPNETNSYIRDISLVDGKIFITILKPGSHNHMYILNQYTYDNTTKILTDKILNIEFINDSRGAGSTAFNLDYYDAKMYHFKKCTIFKLWNTESTYNVGSLIMLKYNTHTKRFEPIFKQFNIRQTVNSISDCELFELSDRIFGLSFRYAFTKMNNSYKADTYNIQCLPPMFEYDVNNNIFKAWHSDRYFAFDGWTNNNRIKWYYNVPQIVSSSTDRTKSMKSLEVISIHNIPENKIDTLVPDEIHKTNFIFGDYEYIYKDVVITEENDDLFKKVPTIIARHLDTGVETPIFNDSIMWKRNLSGVYHFKTKDIAPDPNKVYYKVNQQKTCFIGVKDLLNITGALGVPNAFTRREISDELVRVDTTVQTAPLIGQNYYTKDLYGNVTPHEDLCAFTPGEVYFEKTYDYIQIDPIGNGGNGNIGEFMFVALGDITWDIVDASNGFDPNVTYYESVYLYDSEHDSEAEGKDNELLINITGYVIQSTHSAGKPHLLIMTQLEFNHPLYNHNVQYVFGCEIDGNNVLDVKRTILDLYTIVTNIGELEVIVETYMSRIIIFKNDKLIANKQFDLFTFNLNSSLYNFPIMFERNGFIYFYGSYGNGGESASLFNVIKYNIETNEFTNITQLSGGIGSGLYNTAFGMYAVLESFDSNNNPDGIDIYKLHDDDTYEHVYKSINGSTTGYERLAKVNKVIDKDGYVEIFIFTQIFNFIRCYRIYRGNFEEILLPKEIMCCNTLGVSDNVSISNGIVNDYAISFYNDIIWHLDTGKIDFIVDHHDVSSIGYSRTYIKLGKGDDAYYHTVECLGTYFDQQEYIGYKVSKECLTDIDAIKLYKNVASDSSSSNPDFGNHLTLPITCNVDIIDNFSVKKIGKSNEIINSIYTMDNVNRQLPIVGPDNILYFCNARVDNSTGMPDYDNQYRIVDDLGNIVESNVCFDKCVFYNGSLYGYRMSTKSIYINRNYHSSNDFIKIFTDTSGNEQLNANLSLNQYTIDDSVNVRFIDCGKLGLFYFNTKQIYKLINNEFINIFTSTDGNLISIRNLVKGDTTISSETDTFATSTSEYIVFNDYQMFFQTDSSFWKYNGSTNEISVAIAVNNAGDRIYSVSHGIYIISTANIYYFPNNTSTPLTQSFPTSVKCRNNPNVSITNDFSNCIYELDNGLTIMIGTSTLKTGGFYIWEAIDTSGYKFVPYCDIDNTIPNISNIGLNVVNTLDFFTIKQVKPNEGYYKLVDRTLAKNLDGIPSSEYDKIFTPEPNNVIKRMSNTKLFFMNSHYVGFINIVDDHCKVDAIDISDDLIRWNLSLEKFAMYNVKIRRNRAIVYNGIIYMLSEYNQNLLVYSNDYLLKRIEVESDDEELYKHKMLGFNLKFISANDNNENRLNYSLADKLFVNLSGVYTNALGKRLDNLKAFVVDNYWNPAEKYNTINKKTIISTQYPSVLENSKDHKDLNIKRTLTDDETDKILSNITNTDDWDESFEVIMELYPAEVEDVTEAIIKKDMRCKGYESADSGYIVSEKRHHSWPYNPYTIRN